MPESTPATHRDVMKIGSTVSELHRDVFQILKGREDNDSHDKAVRDPSLLLLGK
jgi:hypothetical protein